MAKYLSPEQTEEFKKIFDIIDDDSNGTISTNSLERILRTFEAFTNQHNVDLAIKYCKVPAPKMTLPDMNTLLAAILGFFNPIEEAYKAIDTANTNSITRENFTSIYNSFNKAASTSAAAKAPQQAAPKPAAPKAAPAKAAPAKSGSPAKVAPAKSGSPAKSTAPVPAAAPTPIAPLPAPVIPIKATPAPSVSEEAPATLDAYFKSLPTEKVTFTLDETLKFFEFPKLAVPTQLYTHHVYYARFGDVCTGCMRLIMDKKSKIKVDDLYYHPSCYYCAGCDKLLKCNFHS